MNKSIKKLFLRISIIFVSFIFSTNLVCAQSASNNESKKAIMSRERSLVNENYDAVKKYVNIIRQKKTCTVTGKIYYRFSDSSIVITSDSDKVKIMVKYRDDKAAGLKIGDKVKVSFIPYRINNGIVISRGLSLSK